MGKKASTGADLSSFFSSGPAPARPAGPPVIAELRIVEASYRDPRTATLHKTYYCRFCNKLFQGPPVVKNSDPTKDPKWDVNFCPLCDGCNPYFVRNRDCAHEKEDYKETEMENREWNGRIYCNLMKCWIHKPECLECKKREPI